MMTKDLIRQCFATVSFLAAASASLCGAFPCLLHAAATPTATAVHSVLCIFRLRPAFVVGIPVARAIRCFADVIPTARFQLKPGIRDFLRAMRYHLFPSDTSAKRHTLSSGCILCAARTSDKMESHQKSKKGSRCNGKRKRNAERKNRRHDARAVGVVHSSSAAFAIWRSFLT